MFLHYSMGHHSVERRALKSFAEIFFCGQFSSKKKESFDIFLKQIQHSPLPTAILQLDAHFLQTLLQDPFNYCLVNGFCQSVCIHSKIQPLTSKNPEIERFFAFASPKKFWRPKIWNVRDREPVVVFIQKSQISDH